MMRRMVIRLCGHSSAGPRPVAAHSVEPISAAISPPARANAVPSRARCAPVSGRPGSSGSSVSLREYLSTMPNRRADEMKTPGISRFHGEVTEVGKRSGCQGG